jgi:hypothetical protein
MSQICHQLHKLFNSLPIYNFPFDTKKITKNGIYILFEKGELSHGTNRIVRIGTHTGDNQLRSRLEQHFIQENKDRSIFRKNIGRTILNRENDPFLSHWEYDLTSSEAKRKYSMIVDFTKQKQIEREVTKYIQQHFRFIVISIADKERRLDWESRIISTVSLCKECKPSETWIGQYSTKEKIQQSGLWLVNNLYKTPLSQSDYNALENAIID